MLLLFQIHDGKDNTAHVLGAFTGSSMLGLTLISTSNHLWLEFYSDAESTGEGFKLVYSSECAQLGSINNTCLTQKNMCALTSFMAYSSWVFGHLAESMIHIWLRKVFFAG